MGCGWGGGWWCLWVWVPGLGHPWAGLGALAVGLGGHGGSSPECPNQHSGLLGGAFGVTLGDPLGGNGGCYPLTPDCFDWDFCPALYSFQARSLMPLDCTMKVRRSRIVFNHTPRAALPTHSTELRHGLCMASMELRASNQSQDVCGMLQPPPVGRSESPLSLERLEGGE